KASSNQGLRTRLSRSRLASNICTSFLFLQLPVRPLTLTHNYITKSVPKLIKHLYRLFLLHFHLLQSQECLCDIATVNLSYCQFIEPNLSIWQIIRASGHAGTGACRER